MWYDNDSATNNDNYQHDNHNNDYYLRSGVFGNADSYSPWNSLKPGFINRYFGECDCSGM